MISSRLVSLGWVDQISPHDAGRTVTSDPKDPLLPLVPSDYLDSPAARTGSPPLSASTCRPSPATAERTPAVPGSLQAGRQ